MTRVPRLAPVVESGLPVEPAKVLADAASAAPVECAKRPRKPRAKPERRPVMRADRLASNLTPSKARAIGVLFDAWSACALALGREQWRATAVAFSA